MKGALSMAKYERNPSARLSPRHVRGEQDSPRQPRRKRIGLLATVCLIALAGAVGIAAQAISGLLARSEPQTVSKTIVWQDNNNEEDLRPSPDPEEGESSYAAPTLTLTIGEGDSEKTYTAGHESEEAMHALASLNMTSWPDYTITPTGSTWTLSYGKLNTTVYELDPETGEIKIDDDDNPVSTGETASWSLTPPEQDGYTLIDSASASGEYEGIEANTWYYLLEDTNTFTIDLRHGSLTNLQGIAQAIMEQFQLGASYSSGGTWLNIPFVDLEGNKGYADVVFQTWKEGEWVSWNPDEDTGEIPEELRLSIVAPKYTVNGEPITYRVSEIAGEGEAPDNKLDYTSDSLEDGDHFAISYDNTASSNHSSDREGAYNGGSVIFTLTGTVDYHATKVWQDAADSSNRPGVELQLWRYRADQDLSSAAPVRDENGGTYSITIEAGSEEKEVPIAFTNEDGTPVDFPKYDAEGYRYIYVVREYAAERAISGYDQVFGEIDENGNVVKDSDVVLGQEADGTVTDTNTRAEGNTYLYNGGTLNNVLSGTVETSATKVWEAPAFQAEFGNVSVEVTLQSRPKGAGDDAWANVQGENGAVTATIGGFTAENLSGVTVTQSMPQYDGLGRRLEYRWVETGVYQEGTEGSLLEEDGSFTLRQQEQGSDALRDVHYTSEVTYPTNEDGTASTLITNSVDGEISYDVDKWWELSPEEADAIEGKETNSNYKLHGNTWYTKEYPIDEDDADSATFYLYRVRSGEELNITSGSYYLSFTMYKDGEPVLTPQNVEEGVTLSIENSENSPWHVTIEGLPEFDEDGRQYF